MHSFPEAASRPPATGARGDIQGRADIERLVNAFYARVQQDDLIGPIFTDVARVNWAAHLPRMYDFWQSVLFGTPGFKGNPLVVHRTLARLTPLTAEAFDRWVALFQATVDDLFAGPMADEARRRAAAIAGTLQYHVGA
jgi:hemoglobin